MSNPFTGLSVESARRALAAQLRSAQLEEAELDARILLGAALGLDLTGLVAQAARLLSEAETSRLAQYAGRRIAGEPVARILGSREFWGLPFRLSEATLVPRPDTETVVELALEIFRERQASRQMRIADIGTGSGAILLALLHDIPGAFGVGTDLSLTALKTARDNAAALGLADRASFVACSYAAALRGPFDLVVSNPPYVRADELEALAPELAHEPVEALVDRGQTERLIETARFGWLVLEIHEARGAAIAHRLEAAGYEDVRVSKDLAGRDRIVEGRWIP